MGTEKIRGITELLGINPESPVFSLIEGSADALPYIGKVYSAFKTQRLQLRLKRVEGRLSSLSYLMIEQDNKLLDEFIRKKAFPVILDELFEEHEEEKIDLIINGLEYTYKNEVREESKMLAYFDVLREMRVDEIKKLLEFSREYLINFRPSIDLQLFDRDDKEGRAKHRENQGYSTYIENHLAKLGLLDASNEIQRAVEIMFKQLNDPNNNPIIPKTGKLIIDKKLTQFGENFIKFFELTQLMKIPAE
ncbi:hypothetical protein [Paenibacillus sp. FSL H7-0714]|uniref:hypothetical protein n=1 Tax=Paenibacillus sp. FSL H7-0714 TaxID=2954735 RepID=UPI0030F5F39F